MLVCVLSLCVICDLCVLCDACVCVLCAVCVMRNLNRRERESERVSYSKGVRAFGVVRCGWA